MLDFITGMSIDGNVLLNIAVKNKLLLKELV